jgi:hypothetical protein
MATGARAGQGVVETTMQIGDDLWIEWADVAELREQDVNAQQMQPRHMDRLTENIRIRGQIESLPYCHQPDGTGPISIVSGHHRARAARTAGLTRIPVIVDKQSMTHSKIVAKQIAHNELHGDPDQGILAQLVASLESVDDLLMSGLDENWLPTPQPVDHQLLIPHADFDWRTVLLLFLPGQLDRLNDLVELCSDAEMIGAARFDQFDAFSKAVVAVGRQRNVKNMAVVIDHLTQVALAELRSSENAPSSAS